MNYFSKNNYSIMNIDFFFLSESNDRLNYIYYYFYSHRLCVQCKNFIYNIYMKYNELKMCKRMYACFKISKIESALRI